MKIIFENKYCKLEYYLDDEAVLDDVLESVTAGLQGMTYQIDGLEHYTYNRDYHSRDIDNV